MTDQKSFNRRPEQGRTRSAAKPVRPVQTGGRIEQVRQVLDEVVTWQFAADSVVSHWLRAHPAMGLRDRGEVAEAVYNILRHLRRYRQFAESGVGPATRRLAILGLWSTLGRERIAPALDSGEQAWLDRVLQIDLGSLALPVRASVPDWLYDRVKNIPDVEALLDALNKPAALDIRVNPMKADRDEMLADLTKGNGVRYAPEATAYSPWGIRLRGRPAMNKWHQFEHGLIEVQDEGSQLLALLVAPRRGEMVIDFCAGAGGKTLLLGALMRSTGRLYAFDVSAARLARAKPRFARSGLSNISPVAIEHENDTRVRRLAGKAQRVLVDAPCSGIGTLRRNPDLKWRQNKQSLVELTALQARILASASRCVAPGGRLVYATCSILPEENEAQVERFLAAHPDFELVDAAPILAARTPLRIEGPYLKLRPDVHGTDGFFAAVFDRVRKAPASVDQTAAVQQPVDQDLSSGLPPVAQSADPGALSAQEGEARLLPDHEAAASDSASDPVEHDDHSAVSAGGDAEAPVADSGSSARGGASAPLKTAKSPRRPKSAAAGDVQVAEPVDEPPVVPDTTPAHESPVAIAPAKRSRALREFRAARQAERTEAEDAPVQAPSGQDAAPATDALSPEDAKSPGDGKPARQAKLPKLAKPTGESRPGRQSKAAKEVSPAEQSGAPTDDKLPAQAKPARTTKSAAGEVKPAKAARASRAGKAKATKSTASGDHADPAEPTDPTVA